MKKLSILFLSVLTFGLSVTSCSSDDDNSGSIEGKWTPVKIGSVLNGQEILVNIPNDGKCDRNITEFTSDGKFNDIEYEFYNDKCNASTDKGTWSLKDNILTTIYDGDTEVNKVQVLELTKSTLKVKYLESTDPSNSIVMITLYERR